MLNGGSAKTRSTVLAATRGNSIRQSPGYNRSNSNVVAAAAPGVPPLRWGRRSSAETGPPDFARGMVGSLVIARGGRLAGIAVAVPLRSAGGAGLVDAVLGELLVQGVAVDAQPGGGLDLDAVAGLEDLLDQLSLDLADDPVVQVIG